jgi:hypothetical protein
VVGNSCEPETDHVRMNGTMILEFCTEQWSPFRWYLTRTETRNERTLCQKGRSQGCTAIDDWIQLSQAAMHQAMGFRRSS